MKPSYVLPLFFLVVSFNCTSPERIKEASLTNISDQYISLALEIGSYDKYFIDAYYGPIDWQRNANSEEELPYEELKWKSTKLINELKGLDNLDFNELELLRYHYLTKQLEAIRTKLDIMSGKNLPFDVESLRLYDIVAPHIDLSEYDPILLKLNELVPGEGDLAVRYEEYAKEFIIPSEKVDEVFRVAIEEARTRILEEINLPENESFELEYVNDQPWSGYNWYKGDGHSLIQINTDFPIYIERAIDLACHEGYPGHHVYNVMLEKTMVNDQNWQEFQVYPLFSPQSFIAEGTANFGVEMAFGKKERLNFEKDKLFPLAGINPDLADRYYEIQDIRSSLLGAQIQIAREYLNGIISSDEAVVHLRKYLQLEESKAKQRVQFFDRYGSYVINYSLGSDIIEGHVNAGLEDNEKTRWDIYKELLTSPRTASVLQTD